MVMRDGKLVEKGPKEGFDTKRNDLAHGRA